jgi:hypothetical protein
MSSNSRKLGREKLILDLLLHKINEDEFFRNFPTTESEARGEALKMLTEALQSRDSDGVEFGLLMGHHFGFSRDFLGILLRLAGENWHQQHEGVVDTFAEMKWPEAVEVLSTIAVTSYDYREYDDYCSLGVKCIYTLAAIQTQEAILQLGRLARCGNAILEREAVARLTGIAKQGNSPDGRQLACDILNANR